jgi:uncharacterized membrane protein
LWRRSIRIEPVAPTFNVNEKGKLKMVKKTVLGTTVIALVLGLSACGGNDTQTTVKTTETQGQQLLDLREAYDKGVITESEYKKTKNEILKQH